MQAGLDLLLAAKGAFVALWLAAFFTAERLRPAAQMPPAAGPPVARLLRNAGLWAINLALSPLLVVPVSAWAASQGLLWRPLWWSGWWHGWPALAADLLLLDFLIYWWHRANHEWRILWRFHEVHHLDRFLDSSSALRFHFGEVLLSAAARAAAIMLLALPLASVLAFEAAVLCAAIFHHSNVRLAGRLEQALSRVVVTPGIHWVHHHRVRRDTDANYGTLFSFWDRLCRSRSPTPRTPDLEIGVERQEEQDLLRLIVRPFR